jgi:bisphosphoglycerate-independent phosphoglycerate mutase (AlkP superfamily)
VRTIIEKVHFNKKKPENMNVYISSIKGNYVMMYKDNQWQIVNRKETIDTMFDKNEFELESWYDEYKDKYPEIITSFERYIKNKDDYDDTINDVKEDIMLMLYNKRRMLGVA